MRIHDLLPQPGSKPGPFRIDPYHLAGRIKVADLKDEDKLREETMRMLVARIGMNN